MVNLKLILFVIAYTITIVNTEYPEWSFQVFLTESVRLRCNDINKELQQGDEVKWHLPNGQIINEQAAYNVNKYEFMGENVTLKADLMVKNVQSSDSGMYYCMVYRNGQLIRKVNRAINRRGPPLRDSFGPYKNNVIVACIATAVFLFLALAMCFVYHCRYRTHEDRRKSIHKRKYRSWQQRALNKDTVDMALPDYPTGVDNPTIVITHCETYEI